MTDKDYELFLQRIIEDNREIAEEIHDISHSEKSAALLMRIALSRLNLEAAKELRKLERRKEK